MQSICVPVLTYSAEVLQPNKTTINMFNHLIDRAVYIIFKCVDRANIMYIRQSVNLPEMAECIAFGTHKFKVNFRKISWAEVACKLLNS